MANDDSPQRVQDLHDMIDAKIANVLMEANSGGWDTEEALLAINDVIRARWLGRLPKILGAPLDGICDSAPEPEPPTPRFPR